MNGMISSLTTPTVLAFSIIVIGYVVGRIKMWSLSLDLSAILIVAVIAGCMLSAFSADFNYTVLETSMKVFSQLGTALFVAAIGLSCGSATATGVTAKTIVYFLTGAAMVGVAFICIEMVAIIDKELDKSLLLGILCGALTSTPGLSALCEKEGVVSHQAVLGYGCTYLFGVIGTVLFVQWMTRASLDDATNRETLEEKHSASKRVDSLLLIGLSVIFGTVFGHISLRGFSIGTSAGILCVSIVIGIVARWMNVDIHNETVSGWRSFGLMMFFVGSGVPAGMTLSTTFDVKWFVYGLILTMLPILFGYCFARFILKKQALDSMMIIAGGMTSTPAMGALIRRCKSPPDLSIYSFAYVGALISMLCLIRISI